MAATDQGRRTFLKASAAAGGGFLLGFYLPVSGADAPRPEQTRTSTFVPNAWIRVGADDSVTVMVDKSEMGQGVATALPMLVAEELGVDLVRIKTEFAPADRTYLNPELRVQGTGGSTSIKTSWIPLRQAGAAARQMLVAAAAKGWGVSPSACRAENGLVVNSADGRSRTYGALAALAAQMPVPEAVALKPASEFRIIGTRAARVDTPRKVNGRAVFGMDVRLPGMLTATIAHAPVFGGRLERFDADKAMKLPGVRLVVPLEGAIAVVAESYWQAKLGLDALEVEWDAGEHAELSSAVIRKRYRELAEQKGKEARVEGKPQRVMAQAAIRIRCEYELPYLAHATMEPMNCTADVWPESCELWVPTQGQSGAQEVAARITGLPHRSIKVHTTFLGGGFGRRSEQDFVAEAVQLSVAAGAPVKLIWSREEDMQHDYYRPATLHVLQAGLDDSGQPLAWAHRIVGPSILSRVISEFAPAIMPQWLPHFLKSGASSLAGSVAGLSVDRTAVEGAQNVPYAVDDMRVDYVEHDPGVPVGFWRSVGNSHNAFVVESFIDELAVAAGEDPYLYRRGLLRNAPRHVAVLDLAARRSGWEQPAPEGVYRGIAVHASFGSYVAQVAELSVGHDGAVRVHRVVCAVDCGTVINPDTVEAQMEGAIVFGLTAALKGEITIEQGQVRESNFHDYPVLRMNDMPVIEVHIVRSDAPPMGVGEPGTPPIAPALTNAIFAATGKRVRRLPVRPEYLSVLGGTAIA